VELSGEEGGAQERTMRIETAVRMEKHSGAARGCNKALLQRRSEKGRTRQAVPQAWAGTRDTQAAVAPGRHRNPRERLRGDRRRLDPPAVAA